MACFKMRRHRYNFLLTQHAKLCFIRASSCFFHYLTLPVGAAVFPPYYKRTQFCVAIFKTKWTENESGWMRVEKGAIVFQALGLVNSTRKSHLFVFTAVHDQHTFYYKKSSLCAEAVWFYRVRRDKPLIRVTHDMVSLVVYVEKFSIWSPLVMRMPRKENI